MTTTAQGPVRIWRASTQFRILFGVLGAVIIVLGASVPSTDPGESVLWRLGLIGFAVAFCVWPHLVRVEVHAEHVVLRGMLRTRMIALSDLAEVGTSDAGLIFVRRDGHRSLASALVGAKAPLATWLGRRTRGDLRAEQIMAAARRLY